jgi:HEPN domain-containing protein
MKPVVARWLEFAEVDLKAARSLLDEGSLSSVVCFHAQQCVEKSLKALITYRHSTERKKPIKFIPLYLRQQECNGFNWDHLNV